MRNFEEWFGKMRPGINNGYNYYVDFSKVYKNVDKLKVELNIMNSLIGSKDIENDFKNLLQRYPEILHCIPILIAVHLKDSNHESIYVQDSEGVFLYNFKNMNFSVDQYAVFMRKTGLFDLISNHIINNLVDYVLGVEVGLDSHGRKNRGGHQMENLVESFIKKTGAKYYKEMKLGDIERNWNIDLSAISAGGKTVKRWDFVVKTNKLIYMIETNFYASGGSKLNETARSYKMIADEAKEIEGVEFVWITDGEGWKSAKHNLEETFNVMTHLYNISDMENGIFQSLFK